MKNLFFIIVSVLIINIVSNKFEKNDILKENIELKRKKKELEKQIKDLLIYKQAAEKGNCQMKIPITLCILTRESSSIVDMYDRYYKEALQCDAFRFKYYQDTYDDKERDKITDQMIRDGCKIWIGFSSSDDYKKQQKKVRDHDVLVFTTGVTSTSFRNDPNLFQMGGINDKQVLTLKKYCERENVQDVILVTRSDEFGKNFEYITKNMNQIFKNVEFTMPLRVFNTITYEDEWNGDQYNIKPDSKEIASSICSSTNELLKKINPSKKISVWYAMFGEEYKLISKDVWKICANLVISKQVVFLSTDGLSMDPIIKENQEIADITYQSKMLILSYEGNNVKKYERLQFYEKNRNIYKYSHPYQLLNFDSIRLILESYLHIYSHKNMNKTIQQIITTSKYCKGISGDLDLSNHKTREFGDYTLYTIRKNDVQNISQYYSFYQWTEMYVLKYKELFFENIPNLIEEDHSTNLQISLNEIINNASKINNCIKNVLNMVL